MKIQHAHESIEACYLRHVVEGLTICR